MFDRLAVLTVADALGMSPATVRKQFSAADMLDIHAFWQAREKVRDEQRKQAREDARAKRKRR